MYYTLLCYDVLEYTDSMPSRRRHLASYDWKPRQWKSAPWQKSHEPKPQQGLRVYGP